MMDKFKNDHNDVLEAAVVIQTLYRVVLASRILLERVRKHIFRTKVTHELLQTEYTYYSDLENLINVYYANIKTEEVLTEEQLSDIFCNISEIQQIHKKIYQSIMQKLAKWGYEQTVGDIFDEMDFTPYEKYMNNYENAMHTLNEAKKKKKISTSPTIFSRGSSLPIYEY